MRYYSEHVDHALQRQQQDQKLKDGAVIKMVWPWAWGVLKKLEVGWFDIIEPAAPTIPDLFGEKPIVVATNKGSFRIRATQKDGTKDYDYTFELVDVPKAS